MAILPARIDIFDAASKDDIVEVRKFIEQKNVLANATNSVGQTAGHIAAKNGNLRLAQAILEADASVASMRDHWNQTMLHLATKKGALRIVQLLIDEYGVDYLQPNDRLQGITVLHIAAAMGYVHLLKYFIRGKKMDANVRNRLGQTPAFHAAAKGHVNAIRYFGDETDANLTTVDNYGDNILYMSARRGDLDVPRYLLTERKVPFDINWRNIQGETVLKRAIVCDQYQFIKFLIEERRAKVNLADNDGNTPLHEAAILGDFVLVGYLLKQGADPTIKNAENKTSAQVASDHAIIQRLQEPIKPRKKVKVRRNAVYSPELSVRVSPLVRLTGVQTGERIESDAQAKHIPSWEGSGGGGSGSVNLNGLLALGNFIFSYLTGLHSRPAVGSLILSPPETLRIRMDFLALDSVHRKVLSDRVYDD